MRILLASSNPHKLEEIRAILPAEAPIDWVTLCDLDGVPAEPVEDQDTFEGNALLKARYYAGASGLATLADDSGLQVDALGGEPGVRSARYAGADGPRRAVDVANYALLLEKLRDVPDERRTARFVCAMAYVNPHAGDELVLRGEAEGAILRGPRGEGGFGYDPVFCYPHLGKTAAELEPDQKNAISHRGAAVRAIWPELAKRLGNG